MAVRRPTRTELNILSILWRNGPQTVRQVHTEFKHRAHEVGYTTILKFMQVMHEKGFLSRDTSARSHVYTPDVPIEEMQKMLVKEMLDGPFLGSTKSLVLRALSENPSSTEELAEIKEMIDELAVQN